MSRVRIPSELRAAIELEARRRCGYCLTTERIIGTPLEIDHIVPIALGGSNERSNLWLACSLCNAFKGDRIGGQDSETGRLTRLFDPRRQVWMEHFSWSHDNSLIVPLTPTGRVTVELLRLNRPVLVRSRKLWTLAGWHPPEY